MTVTKMRRRRNSASEREQRTKYVCGKASHMLKSVVYLPPWVGLVLDGAHR